MAAWNNTLGTPLLADNSVKRQPNVITTPMSNGKQRRQRFTKVDRSSGVVHFYWDATQKTTWDAYFATTLLHGAVAVDDFPYPLIANNVAQYVHFDADTERVAVPGDLWKVSIPFEAVGRNN